MNVEFLSTVAVVAPDPAASCELYVGALGLPLEGQGDGYCDSERIAGCKSFGIWPLSQAAEACFGTPQWPAGRPVPQVSIEFDVGDAAAVGSAAEEVEQAGYELLHPTRTEPRGQTSPGYSRRKARSSASPYIPVFHDENLTGYHSVLSGEHRPSPVSDVAGRASARVAA